MDIVLQVLTNVLCMPDLVSVVLIDHDGPSSVEDIIETMPGIETIPGRDWTHSTSAQRGSIDREKKKT